MLSNKNKDIENDQTKAPVDMIKVDVCRNTSLALVLAVEIRLYIVFLLIKSQNLLTCTQIHYGLYNKNTSRNVVYTW